MLRTAAGALYTGIATDAARRLREHAASGARAARSLRGRGPLTLVYRQTIGDRSLALRVERALKRLPRPARLALVGEAPERDTLLRRLGLDPPSTADRGPPADVTEPG